MISFAPLPCGWVCFGSGRVESVWHGRVCPRGYYIVSSEPREEGERGMFEWNVLMARATSRTGEEDRRKTRKREEGLGCERFVLLTILSV